VLTTDGDRDRQALLEKSFCYSSVRYGVSTGNGTGSARRVRQAECSWECSQAVDSSGTGDGVLGWDHGLSIDGLID